MRATGSFFASALFATRLATASMRKVWPAVFLLLLVGWSNPARSQNVDCQAILNRLLSGMGGPGVYSGGAQELANYYNTYCQGGRASPQPQQPQYNEFPVHCGHYTCREGHYCGSNNSCLADGTNDCGNGRSCPGESKCSRNAQKCLPRDTVDCGSFFCNSDAKCGSGNKCLAQGEVDCGGGRSCQSGYLCVRGGAECLTRQQLADREEQKKAAAKKIADDKAAAVKVAADKAAADKAAAAKAAADKIAAAKAAADRAAAEKAAAIKAAADKLAADKAAAAQAAADKIAAAKAAAAKDAADKVTAQKVSAQKIVDDKAAAAKAAADKAALNSAIVDKAVPSKTPVELSPQNNTTMAEQKRLQEQNSLITKFVFPSNSTFQAAAGLNTSTAISTVPVVPARPGLSKAAEDRRESGIQRVSNAIGVSDVRNSKELAKLAVAQAAKALSPEVYKGMKNLEGIAGDVAALEKAKREGRFAQEAPRVFIDNSAKLAEMVLKEKKIEKYFDKNKIDKPNIGTLKDTAHLATDTNNYLKQLTAKYETTNAKAVAYNDLATSADRVRTLIAEKKNAASPAKAATYDAALKKATTDLILKKQAVDVAESEDKKIKPDPTAAIISAGKLTEAVLQPHLDPLSKTALALSKEAARDLTTIAVKIESTNAVTRANTDLATSIDAALDAKKIRDSTRAGVQRTLADAKYQDALKVVQAKQQEAEAVRAVDHITRVVPEDSVVGTIADIIAPEQMIRYERNER